MCTEMIVVADHFLHCSSQTQFSSSASFVVCTNPAGHLQFTPLLVSAVKPSAQASKSFRLISCVSPLVGGIVGGRSAPAGFKKSPEVAEPAVQQIKTSTPGSRTDS